MKINRSITIDVVISFDPDTTTFYEAQQRFLETLSADGLHFAEITEGLVDSDDAPIFD